MRSSRKYRDIHEYGCPRGRFPDLYCSCPGGPSQVEIPPCEHLFKHLRQKEGRIVCTACGDWLEVPPLPADWERDVKPDSGRAKAIDSRATHDYKKSQTKRRRRQ